MSCRGSACTSGRNAGLPPLPSPSPAQQENERRRRPTRRQTSERGEWKGEQNRGRARTPPRSFRSLARSLARTITRIESHTRSTRTARREGGSGQPFLGEIQAHMCLSQSHLMKCSTTNKLARAVKITTLETSERSPPGPDPSDVGCRRTYQRRGLGLRKKNLCLRIPFPRRPGLDQLRGIRADHCQGRVWIWEGGGE